MPNWSEGSLRVRGKLDDIKSFLKTLEQTICSDLKYIPDTKRAFVVEHPYTVDELVEILEYETEEKDSNVLTMHMQQAWGVHIDDFVVIAKKYNLDIRIDTVECGMMFTASYVIEKGKLVSSDVKGYKSRQDFEWNVPFNWLGG